MQLPNLWQWQGRITRKTYFIVGVAAFAVKFFLDWLAVTRLFHRPWSLLNYWRPFGLIHNIGNITSPERGMAFVLLTLALPFLWIGLSMTVRRLRDVGQPVWLVVLFFVPLVNLFFFAGLSLLPSAKELRKEDAAPWPGPSILDAWIPRTPAGSALLAIALTATMGLLFTLLGASVLRDYGFGLFVALPFSLGLFSVLTHSYREPRSFGSCMKVALLPIGILGAVLLVVALEGLICILMAAPLALALAALGGALGYAVQAAHWGRKQTAAMLSVAFLFTPSFFSVEHFVRPQPSTFVVRSVVEVNAPPEKLWNEVIAFAEIPPPRETLFRAGIAYPIRAEIYGRGPGAVRHCVFSTGPFVEPIQVWDEPHLLRFSVTENPAPMEELTPYKHIEPPHLHGFFESHQGQFLLTALPGNRTRLEGTTWYTHTLWPESYWRLWSDYVIHRIHLRVLNHIKSRVEAASVPEETNQKKGTEELGRSSER